MLTSASVYIGGQVIAITGPYRRCNDTLIYSFADCIVTEGELLDLARADKLDAEGVSELATKIAGSRSASHEPSN